jgi:hypothetical protein
MNVPKYSLGIVVASCDKYSDLWEPLFGQLFKHWPDCPYPVYLVANNQRYDHPKVITLLAGDDLDWSTTISRAISGLKHSHLMFWIDDAFLSGDVSNKKIESLFNFSIETGSQFLRLRPNPTPLLWLNNEIGVLSKDAAYRVSLFATIWTVEMLNQILRPGESAWQFEVDGTERSRVFDQFYCTKEEVFSYLHGVERGVWILPTANKLKRLGYSIDGVKRPIMTYLNNFGLNYRLFKSFVFHLVPENQRDNTLRYIKRIYKLVGLR